MKATEGMPKCRKQGETYCQRDTAEQEGYGRGHSFRRIAQNNTTNTDRQNEWMLDRILSVDNLNLAYKKGEEKQRSRWHRWDEKDELLIYLIDHRRELILSIRNRTYRPQLIRSE